jgi:hypothetical protein
LFLDDKRRTSAAQKKSQGIAIVVHEECPMKNRLNVPFNAKNRPKKEVDYFTPKRAFDQIMEHYPMEAHINLFGSEEARKIDRRRIKADLKVIYDFYNEMPKKNKKGKAQGIVAAKGVPVKNLTAPTISDFKIDVDRQIRKVIRNRADLVIFFKRYVFSIEDLSKDEQYRFAGYEQRIGSLFIRNKIYPLGKYLISIRKDKVSQ